MIHTVVKGQNGVEWALFQARNGFWLNRSLTRFWGSGAMLQSEMPSRTLAPI
jgi:hypothetical protein